MYVDSSCLGAVSDVDSAVFVVDSSVLTLFGAFSSDLFSSDRGGRL